MAANLVPAKTPKLERPSFLSRRCAAIHSRASVAFCARADWSAPWSTRLSCARIVCDCRSI